MKTKISELLIIPIKFNQIPSYKKDLIDIAIKNNFKKSHAVNFFNSFAARGKLVNLGDRVQDIDGFIERVSEDMDILTNKAIEICKEHGIKQTDAMWIKSKLDEVTIESKDYDKHEIKEILKLSKRFTIPNNFTLICDELEGFEYKHINDLLAQIFKGQILPTSPLKICELLSEYGREYGISTLCSYTLVDENSIFDKWDYGFILKKQKEKMLLRIEELLKLDRDIMINRLMSHFNAQSMNDLVEKSNIKKSNFYFKSTDEKMRFIIKLSDSGFFNREF